MQFEETGRFVPYLIIPDTKEGRNPAMIVQCVSQLPPYRIAAAAMGGWLLTDDCLLCT